MYAFSRFLLLLTVTVILSGHSAAGQGRKFLRDKITEWGACKNVAMTRSGGDIALTGRNGWAAIGIPKDMSDRLSTLNAKNELIDDVVLTEDGSWLILWGTNGVSWRGCPSGLESKIRQWNDNNEVINSITFNDTGDWIMISDTKYTASNPDLMEWIKDGENDYGELWAANLTNTGLAVVYERGYKFLGEVPGNLKQKLEETSLDVYRLKFLSNGSYFIADKKGRYEYYL